MNTRTVSWIAGVLLRALPVANCKGGSNDSWGGDFLDTDSGPNLHDSHDSGEDFEY